MDLVDIEQLPKDQKKSFQKWMAGQTQPLFVDFPKSNFAYYDDYRNWYGAWLMNKVADIYD